MHRRRALAVIGSTALASLAGCAGITGTTFEYRAAPASIPEDVAAAKNYAGEPPSAMELEETIEVAGVSRDVAVTTWSAAYVAEDGEATLAVVSTPDVEVAGQSVNPLARTDGADLAVRLLEDVLENVAEGASVRDVESVDTARVTVLGEEAVVTEFAAVLETDRGDVPIRLHLVSVTHEGDVVMAIGLHPEGTKAREELHELIESIEH